MIKTDIPGETVAFVKKGNLNSFASPFRQLNRQGVLDLSASLVDLDDSRETFHFMVNFKGERYPALALYDIPIARENIKLQLRCCVGQCP